MKKPSNLMARRRSMEPRRPRAARRPTSFLMVLIEDDFSDQLIVPLAFHKHFDGKVPQQSLLRTPARAWKVNVKKVNDRLFFKKGWKKFVHDNGLKMREFLVFHYAGNSEFDVEIFGTDSCKRGSAMGIGQSDRPLDEEGHGNGIHRKCPKSKHVGSSTRHGKYNIDDQGGTSAAGTRTRKATSSFKKEVVLIDSETSESEDASDSETIIHIDEPKTDQLSEDSEIRMPSTDRTLVEEKHGNVIKRKFPRSKHVGSSTRYGKLNVDDQGGSSAAGTSTRQAIKKVVVIDSETSEFEASESEEAFDSETSESEEAFDSESETSESQTSMHIDEPQTDQPSEDSEIQTTMHTDEPGADQIGEATALERANAFKPESAFLRGEGNPQKRRINSMSKNLKRYETSQSEAYESEISESETDELSRDSEIGLPRDQLGCRNNFSWEVDCARALEAAKKYSSSIRHPSFISVLKTAYVHKGLLHIPKSFLDQMGRSVDVMLQVSEELWPMRCLHDQYATKISAGWLNFVKHHDLKVGDVCVFELIGRDDVPVIKVSFFRC